MINKQLTWPEFKALYQLYHERKTNLKVQERPYFKYLKREGYIKKKIGSTKTIEPYSKFDDEYERENYRRSISQVLFLSVGKSDFDAPHSIFGI